MINQSLRRIGNEIVGDLEEKLQRAGLLYRIFSRVKPSQSIDKKIQEKDYVSNGKKLQDAIGVRITAYFNDDVDFIIKIIRENYHVDNVSLNIPSVSDFSPERKNFVIRLNSQHAQQFIAAIDNPYVDETFEVQLRTVLSEGWHEVEHDLRYKCLDEWKDYDEKSRVLNGIWATLSNCDWSMLTLFDQLSYDNYKNNQWEAMIRNKFRLRLIDCQISNNISEYMSSQKEEFSKHLFRLERQKFLTEVHKKNIYLPMKYDNIIFLANSLHIHDQWINSITPQPILEMVM